MAVEKSLDRKIAALVANPHASEFILADAKDADMALGIGAPGRSPEAHAGEAKSRTLREYRDLIREVVRQQLVDIMLMSASTSEVLTLEERIFENSPVTPAARANDATDVHVVRGGRYIQQPARPFRTATLDHIQCGKMECEPAERTLGANLGLYSVTFTNNTDDDLVTLEAFNEFRLEAERKNFRYFLEIFDPNVPAMEASLIPGFINDQVARILAGVTRRGRPLFLKMVYHGPRAMEELFRYDPSLIIGILGGSAGTTYDAFKLLAEARKYGAKVALYGRKINGAENQFAFIRFLRLIADGVIEPEEAVKAYHGVLERLGVKPHRSLADDMVLQTNVMSYGGNGKTISIPLSPSVTDGAALTTAANVGVPAAKQAAAPENASHACACHATAKPAAGDECQCHDTAAVPKPPALPTKADGSPDIGRMTSSQRLDYFRQRIAKRLGV